MNLNMDNIMSVVMPSVREAIMKKLDILSLVNCRLVSRPWNATASDFLKKTSRLDQTKMGLGNTWMPLPMYRKEQKFPIRQTGREHYV